MTGPIHPDPTRPDLTEHGLPWLAHYEPSVPPTIDAGDHSLLTLLRDSVARYPQQVAVRMVLRYLPGGIPVQARLTYRELDEQSNRCAAALAQLGVGPGSRVAIMLPNLPQLVVAYFGVLKLGAIVVNTNPTYPAYELAPLFAETGVETVITLSALHDRVREVQAKTPLRTIILTDVPDWVGWPLRLLVARQARAQGLLKDVPPAPDVHFLRDLLSRAPATPPAVTIDPRTTTAVLQFTGGTSGLPKAAELTHANLVANVMQVRAWAPSMVAGKEKLLLTLPAFHSYGMTLGMLIGLVLGAEVILIPNPRDTGLVLEIIHRERVTYYPGVPTMYVAIINHPDLAKYDLGSVKVCISGGAPLPVEVVRRFEALTGGRLIEGYGMSEASPLTAGNPVNGLRKVGSIGVPVSSTEMAVVALEPDPAGASIFLATGEEGELVVRGPQVMKGYYNNPEETARTIDPDGWLHTGDIGRMDEDGYFVIVDRKKDLIIAAGFNIVPREVEDVLFTHPKVFEAAVAGVPDPRRGETVKAYIVLKPGQEASADELRDFCKERLAPYKVPTQYEFRTELPKTQVGKTLRRALVEEEKQRLGLAPGPADKQPQP